jgi:sigma-B regulation protein RsbU (phosphoserine phosphatase)
MRMPWSQLAVVMLGAVLVFIGIAAAAIALTRRRREVRILAWFGLLTGIYGGRMLLQVATRQAGLSDVFRLTLDYSISIASYLILVMAILFWLELSLGTVRRLLQIAVFPAVFIAIAGISFTLTGRSPGAFMPLNNALSVGLLLIVLTISATPGLSRRFLVVPGRALAAGSLVLGTVAIYVNLSGVLRLPRIDALEPPAFAIFVFSLGYVAAQRILANERRLLSIDNELEIARGIQGSILPSSVPELDRVRVAAAYRPMTAVGGDFYEFIVVDRHRVGFLVADVSGHGVPAALIASMVKVAIQSAVAHAHEPDEVLRGLNRVLSGQLRGQFVTAAYLWMDTETRKARYSAAGHPPLLYWRATDGELLRVDSNGLLFGVLPDADYPVCDLVLAAGDRLLLYTDGVIEAENARGDFFGDAKLEEVVRAHHTDPASVLSDLLLREVRNWQPKAAPQQDDITLVVIDVL